MARLLTVFFLLQLFISAQALAVPNLINHSGQVILADNEPLTGLETVTFSLYTLPENGTLVWSETIPVTFDNGYYSVALGLDESLTAEVFDREQIYLGVQLEGQEEFEPRTHIVAVPYCLQCESCESVTGTVYDRNGNTVIDEDGNWTGGIMLGTVNQDCSSQNEGTLRWTDGVLQVCTGDRWRTMALDMTPEVDSIEPPVSSEHGGIITINGANFQNGCTVFLGETEVTDVEYVDEGQIVVTLPATSPGTYDLTIYNPLGSPKVIEDGWTSRTDNPPTWDSSGDLGSVSEDTTGVHFTLSSDDPEGDSVTYSIVDGELPPGLVLDSDTGEISGDPEDVSSATESTFTVRATSTIGGHSQHGDSTFSITITNPPTPGLGTVLLLTTNGNTSGDVEDKSDSGHEATRAGVTYGTTSPKFGSSVIEFSGSSSYINFPDSETWDFGAENFTVEAWIRTSNNSRWVLFNQGTGASHGGMVKTVAVDFLSGTSVMFGYRLAGQTRVDRRPSFSSIANNQWHHICVMRTDNLMEFYIDGTRIISDDIGTASLEVSDDPFMIGRYSNGLNNYNFRGQMDDFRVSKGIAQYTSGSSFTPPSGHVE